MQSGFIYRVIRVVFIALMSGFVFAGYFAARSILWDRAEPLAQDVSAGFTSAAGVIAVVGILYAIGGFFIRNVYIDWFSGQFGTLVGALLYGVLNTLYPLTTTAFTDDLSVRFLQGAVDGAFIGGIIGMVTWVLNGRPLRMNRVGIIRYITLFFIVIVAVWVATLISTADATFLFTIGITAVLLFFVKLVVMWINRHSPVEDNPRYEDYYETYDDLQDEDGV